MNPASPGAKTRPKASLLGPWPDVATARSFLAFLAGYREDTEALAKGVVDEGRLATWLARQELGPLAYTRCQGLYPGLANLLQQDRYAAVAANSLHQHNLQLVTEALARAGIPAVLLKGAALAETIPGGWEKRTMSDVDLWLRKEDFEGAGQVMRELGFSTGAKDTRPRALQMMSGGEIQYFKEDWQIDLVEFHLSPFKGWWLTRTAAVDKQALSSRIEPLAGRESVFHLSTEDSVVHIAVHMAVNHQCSLYPLRSLLDIAQIDNSQAVEWALVVARARQMRVRTAVWLVLNLLQQLGGAPGLAPFLQQLQPGGWRRRQLLRLASPEALLLGADLSSGRMRFLYLLMLVDRRRDMGHLVLRTLWPEEEWLRARYGRPMSHWQHLAYMLRQGQI